MNARLLAPLAAAVCLVCAGPAEAAPVNVTVHTAGELQQAITDYNADASDDGYVIRLAPGTYSLADEIVVTNNAGALSLLGSGARTTVLRATGAHRVMHLGDSNHHAEIDDLTITGGDAGENAGGGILSARPLDLLRVTISGNSAQNGGGIASAAHGLGVVESTFSGNSASVQSATFDTGGGAIDNQSGVYVRNSTFSGNSVAGTAAHPARGGAIRSLPSGPDSEIYFSTFAGNDVTGPNAAGRDLATAAATSFYTYVNSNIYASEPVGGAPSGQPHNCADVNVTGASGSHDLDSGSSCDGQSNSDAGLQALADNGGPTDTHALSAGSVAIDVTGDCAAINRGPASTDQRGLARPFTVDGQCDAGAYELQSGNDLALTMSGSPDPVQPGNTATFTTTVSATGPSGDATQPTLTTAVPAGATLVSITPSQGVCSGTTCSLGALLNGSNATVTMVVLTTAPGTLSSNASVTGPRPETTTANNSAAASVAVVPVPPTTVGGQTQTQPKNVISRLRFAHAHFRARKGSRVSFTLSSAGKVTFKVQRKACAKKKKHCTWKKAGKSFKRNGKAGSNGFRFVRRSLRPGPYRLVATPAGRGAKPQRASFTIVP